MASPKYQREGDPETPVKSASGAWTSLARQESASGWRPGKASNPSGLLCGQAAKSRGRKKAGGQLDGVGEQVFKTLTLYHVQQLLI